MHGPPRYATLRDYLRVLRQQRRVIALVTVACAAAALGLTLREDPVYLATTSLAARDIVEEYALIGEDARGVTSPAQLAALTADLVTRNEVAEGAKRRMRSRESARALQSRVGTRVDARTNLVILEARARDAQQAAKTANAFAAESREVARRRERRRLDEALTQLEREVAMARRAVRGDEPGADVRLGIALQRLSQLRTVTGLVEPVEIVQRAQAPSTPVSPKPIRDTLLGGLLGLVLGIVVAFGRDSLDRRLRSSAEVQAELDLPVLARVSHEALGKAGLASTEAVEDRDLEAFRILRTNLEFLSPEQAPRVVLVTSGLPEEGKSTVAASLAAAAVAAGKKTVLLECDLRRPSLSERLGVERTPGLSDYLVGAAQPAEVLRTVSLYAGGLNGRGGEGAARSMSPPLVCIMAGTVGPRPAELLGSGRVRDLLRDLRQVYDLVVCDTSPLLSVVDTLELVPEADGVLVCVRAGRTTRDQAHAVKEALSRVPDRPTGVVLTGIRGGDDEAYGYYSYAYSSSG